MEKSAFRTSNVFLVCLLRRQLRLGCRRYYSRRRRQPRHSQMVEIQINQSTHGDVQANFFIA